MGMPLAGCMGARDGADDMRAKGATRGAIDAKITIFEKRAKPTDEFGRFGVAGCCGGHGVFPSG
jgi:hypothetical protein